MAQSPVSTQGQSGPGRDWELPSDGAEARWFDIGAWSGPAPAEVAPSTAASHGPGGEIAQVLSAWRAAERRLADLVEASPLRLLMSSEVARLRAEYQRLFARAIR